VQAVGVPGVRTQREILLHQVQQREGEGAWRRAWRRARAGGSWPLEDTGLEAALDHSASSAWAQREQRLHREQHGAPWPAPA